MAWDDFKIDYNARDDPRVTPKPQHKDAWQSPNSLLQFAIDVYGQHKSEGLDRKQHVNFRPAVFNEPVPASLKNYSTELDGDPPSLFSTIESESIESRVSEMDEHAQFLVTIHRRSSGGSGKPTCKNNIGCHSSQPGEGNPSAHQTAPDRFAAGRRKQDIFDEVKQARATLQRTDDQPSVFNAE